MDIAAGAQTGRRGSAGPVRAYLTVTTSPAAFCSHRAPCDEPDSHAERDDYDFTWGYVMPRRPWHNTRFEKTAWMEYDHRQGNRDTETHTEQKRCQDPFSLGNPSSTGYPPAMGRPLRSAPGGICLPCPQPRQWSRGH